MTYIADNKTFERSVDAERFLEAATEIADTLLGKAIWHGERCTWLGYDIDAVDHEWKPVLRSLDESLYGGLPGVALFLASLASATGQDPYAAAARIS